MRLAVLSDIHSNYYALMACIEWIKENKADGIVFLGDYVSDCANPQKTMELLYQVKETYKTWFICGNRDTLLASGNIPSYLESMRYTYENLSQKDLWFFASMPATDIIYPDGYPPFSISHGDFHNEREELFPGTDAIDRLLLEMRGNLHLCGHTHVSFIYEKNGKQIVNPGSAGIPQDGTPQAKMAVIESDGEDWTVNLVSVDYDVEKTVEEIYTSGLFERANAFSRSIIATIRSGHDYKNECLKLVMKYEASGETNTGTPELWARAADELGI